MKPLLLDISRLVSRVGRGPLTGIDRVELAYLKRFLTRPEEVWFLCRMPRSHALLDREGGQILFNEINADKWHSSSILERLILPRMAAETRTVMARVWRLATWRCRDSRLRPCLSRLFPRGVRYFNVGHSNLRAAVLRAVKVVENSEINVLIHDIIPISYPEFSRLEVTGRFQTALRLVSELADRVIYISAETRAQAEAVFADFGRAPPGLVCHLGVDRPSRSAQIYEKPAEKPNFVIIGTIEPRKNHALLLSLWQEFKQSLPFGQVPHLHVIGRRGWGNESVFNILDSGDKVMEHVTEHNGLSDSEMQVRLGQSWGLLSPSFTEGFGLPPVEAAHAGVPVICSDIPVYHEILGDYPAYLNQYNNLEWDREIRARAMGPRETVAERQKRADTIQLSSWDQHFDHMFRFTCQRLSPTDPEYTRKGRRS